MVNTFNVFGPVFHPVAVDLNLEPKNSIKCELPSLPSENEMNEITKCVRVKLLNYLSRFLIDFMLIK